MMESTNLGLFLLRRHIDKPVEGFAGVLEELHHQIGVGHVAAAQLPVIEHFHGIDLGNPAFLFPLGVDVAKVCAGPRMAVLGHLLDGDHTCAVFNRRAGTGQAGLAKADHDDIRFLCPDDLRFLDGRRRRAPALLFLLDDTGGDRPAFRLRDTGIGGLCNGLAGHRRTADRVNLRRLVFKNLRGHLVAELRADASRFTGHVDCDIRDAVGIEGHRHLDLVHTLRCRAVCTGLILAGGLLCQAGSHQARGSDADHAGSAALQKAAAGNRGFLFHVYKLLSHLGFDIRRILPCRYHGHLI